MCRPDEAPGCLPERALRRGGGREGEGAGGSMSVERNWEMRWVISERHAGQSVPQYPHSWPTDSATLPRQEEEEEEEAEQAGIWFLSIKQIRRWFFQRVAVRPWFPSGQVFLSSTVFLPCPWRVTLQPPNYIAVPETHASTRSPQRGSSGWQRLLPQPQRKCNKGAPAHNASSEQDVTVGKREEGSSGTDGWGPFLFSAMGGRQRAERGWAFICIYLQSGTAFISHIDVGFVVQPCTKYTLRWDHDSINRIFKKSFYWYIFSIFFWFLLLVEMQTLEPETTTTVTEFASSLLC